MALTDEQAGSDALGCRHRQSQRTRRFSADQCPASPDTFAPAPHALARPVLCTLQVGHGTDATMRWSPVIVKVRDAIKLLEADCWRHVRTTGSHRQYRHDSKPGTVTVAGKPGAEVPRGTLNSILNRAALKKA